MNNRAQSNLSVLCVVKHFIFHVSIAYTLHYWCKYTSDELKLSFDFNKYHGILYTKCALNIGII